MDYENWERSIDLFLETTGDTYPLLEKIQIVASEKQKHQQDEV